jgi:hypothetical protein
MGKNYTVMGTTDDGLQYRLKLHGSDTETRMAVYELDRNFTAGYQDNH